MQELHDDPQQLHDRAQVYLSEYFQSLAARSMVLVLLEDVHWADDSSLDTISQLALALPNRRLLVVCTARPSLFERRPHWGEGQSFHTRLTLPPLSRRDSRQLVSEILSKVDDIPPFLRDLVVDGAEGNPFYLEEIVKMLIEDGAIQKGEDRWKVDATRLSGVRVPPTLTGVLQARLDSLPLEERAALQQAAVVGRLFWDSALARLSAAAQPEAGVEKIPVVLSALRSREMIFQREASTFSGAQEYTFKHATLRDVAYESILKRVRRDYHAVLADWLVGQSGERVGEMVGLIAEHLERAGRDAEAIAYLSQAGGRAVAQDANAEAVDYFSRALKLLAQVDWAPERLRQQQFALLLGREGVYGLLGRRQEQAADLAAMETLAGDMSDARLRMQAALRRADFCEATSDFKAAMAAAQDAVRYAEEASDECGKAEGLIGWGIAAWQQGNLDEARRRLEQALALAQQHNNQPCMASSLRDLGVVAYFVGDLQSARQHSEQALEIHRTLGDRRGEALCLRNLVAVYDGLGDLSRARTYSEQALAIYQLIGDRRGEANALSNLAGIQRARGDLNRASEHYRQARQMFQSTGDQFGEALAMDGLGLTCHDLGDDRAASQLYQQALTVVRAIGDRQGEGYTLNHLGMTQESLGELEPAAASFEAALQLRRDIGQAALTLDDLAGLARVRLRQGRVAEALTHVEEALGWIESQGVECVEYPLRVYLSAAEVLAAAGQAERAEAAIRAARALLHERAAAISDEASRRAFLENVPLHRMVMSITSLPSSTASGGR